MYEAIRRLGILSEGTINGVILYLKYKDPNITKKEIKKEVKSFLTNVGWSKDRIKYWLNQFGLEE